MTKLTFRRVRGVEMIELDLEHLTVIVGDDEVGKEALMTRMYEMIGSASDIHADGASMEVEGSPGVSGVILYDTPLVIRGVFADGCDHRSELWGMLMDDRPDVHPFRDEPKGYRTVMETICPGNLEPGEDGLTYRLPDGGSIDVFALSEDVVPFAVLKRLRIKGFLSEGTLLMMINPDAGMHNAVVNRFSEVLGYLVRDRGVGVTLCTNNPDLVEACGVFPYVMGAVADFKTIRVVDGIPDVGDVEWNDPILSWFMDHPSDELVLEMRRNGYPRDDEPGSPGGLRISVSGVKGVPDFDMWIDRMTVACGCGGIRRGRVSDLVYSMIEPFSLDHDCEDRATVVAGYLDGLFGGVDNYRVEGMDAILESDGIRVEVNGDIVLQGASRIPHVVYLDEHLPLAFDSSPACVSPGLSEMMIPDPVRTLDAEPDPYGRIMDGMCPGAIVHEGGSLRFIHTDGMVCPVDEMLPHQRFFAVIKRLRSNGRLCEGSLLIIRDPEVHMHSTTLRSLVELLVVMSGRMGVRILILTREPLVVMGSHIMSCRHGTESRYLRISGDSIRMCTSMDLTGIFTEGIREINDLRWGGDE